MEELFETCGYLASFLGTFIEGEILLLTSVVSAKLGYFNFTGGLIAAYFGAFVRDTLQFLIVKKQGTKLLDKNQKFKSKVEKASGWFNKNPFLYLMIYRFIYGFSSVIIALSGLNKDMSYKRFAFYSSIGIGLWVFIYGSLGYFCANELIEKITFVSEHSIEVIGILTIFGLGYWFFYKRPKDQECFSAKE